MALNRKFTEKINRAEFENNANLNATERALQTRFNAAGGLGYYQKTNVEDIINNFLATHVGDDKVLKKVPKYEAAFHAQRAVQEFSYDVFYSEKAVEFEIGDRLAFPLPSDYVNYVKVSWTDYRGDERTALPARRVTGKKAILQDDEFNALYDQEGEFLFAELSETIKRYQDPNSLFGTGSNASDFYYGNFDEDNYSYYYNIYFGRRYGLEPQYSNTNGTFVIDTDKGVIYFDPSFFREGFNGGRGTNVSDDVASNDNTIVTLRYVSDGLADNDDLTQVFVHKMAEDAIYHYLLYNLTKVRPTTVGISAAYKREASAKMRNAKIRLMNLKSEELVQVMRGRAKWIKH